MTKTQLALRPMNEADLDGIAEWLSDFHDVSLFDRGLPVPVGREFVAQSWKPAIEYGEPPRALWFVAETSDQQTVGMCGLQSINYIHGDAIVPLFVDRQYRGKGLASLMLLTLLDLTFNQLRLHRVSSLFRADNEASLHLMKIAGFEREGTTREGWFADGRHHDIVHVGLLRTEWSKRQTKVCDLLSQSKFEFSHRTTVSV